MLLVQVSPNPSPYLHKNMLQSFSGGNTGLQMSHTKNIYLLELQYFKYKSLVTAAKQVNTTTIFHTNKTL